MTAPDGREPLVYDESFEHTAEQLNETLKEIARAMPPWRRWLYVRCGGTL